MPIARLSSADMSALAFDAPETPMLIMAIAWLEAAPLLDAEGRLALDSIRRQVERRLERAPRLRQVVRGGAGLFGRAAWVDADDFDIARHVTASRLTAPGTEEHCLELAARIFMEPLERSRPLWELRFVEGLDDGRLAMIVKIHHAIADGPAAVRLLATLFDLVPETSGAIPDQRPPRPDLGPRGRVASALAAIRRYASAVAAMTRAPVMSLNRPVGLGRRLAIVRIPLDEAKDVAHAAGAKVNDVFLALTAAGAHAILKRRGEIVPGGVSPACSSVFAGTPWTSATRPASWPCHCRSTNRTHRGRSRASRP